MGKFCKISVSLICIVMFISSMAYAGTVQCVSVSSDGVHGNSYCQGASLSSDGRFITFASAANNLVSGDTNGVLDVFVYDRQTSKIERVSISNDGGQAAKGCATPSISADGGYFAFASFSDNLVSEHNNGICDVFIRDMQADKTECVSISYNGLQADDSSNETSISKDGRYVAFQSKADNLVSDDTNGYQDIFVRDMQTGTTKRVSISNNGDQANYSCFYSSISADGRYVTFESRADTLVSGDTNGKNDVFIRDMQTDEIQCVSMLSGGVQGNGGSYNPFVSADGRYVTFESDANNFVSGDTNECRDVFVKDIQTGEIERISVSSAGVQGNDGSASASISVDGRFIAFQSYANNLVPGDSNIGYSHDYVSANDIFIRDRLTGTTRRVSVTSDGVQANSDSYAPLISADGKFVTFLSEASNLVSGDINKASDVFVCDLIIPVTGVTLDKTTLFLASGNSKTLLATVSPSEATNGAVTWSSSNNAIATVDTSGKVTAVSNGTCKITVTTVDGTKTAVCLVNVQSVIYFTSPTTDDFYDSVSKTINISGACDSSIVRVSWKIGSKLYSSCKLSNGTWSVNKIGLTLGDNHITVTATDKSKMTYTATLLVDYIDNICPEVKILSPTSKSVYSIAKGVINISALVKDLETITAVTWKNTTTGASGVCTGSKTWKASGIALNLGDNEIIASAEDSSGNIGTGKVIVTRIDKVKPKVAITTPTTKSSLTLSTENIALGGTASDDIEIKQIEWLNKSTGISGVCSGKTAWSSTIPLKIGKNSIVVTASDTSNNKTVDTIAVTRK